GSAHDGEDKPEGSVVDHQDGGVGLQSFSGEQQGSTPQGAGGSATDFVLRVTSDEDRAQGGVGASILDGGVALSCSGRWVGGVQVGTSAASSSACPPKDLHLPHELKSK
ncbi:unnamed protein product, partial [Amoebophrya sp. A25]